MQTLLKLVVHCRSQVHFGATGNTWDSHNGGLGRADGMDATQVSQFATVGVVSRRRHFTMIGANARNALGDLCASRRCVTARMAGGTGVSSLAAGIIPRDRKRGWSHLRRTMRTGGARHRCVGRQCVAVIGALWPSAK